MRTAASQPARLAISAVLWHLVLLICAGQAFAQGADTRFVRANAPAGGNGTSWATAYNNLKAALTAANSNQSIKKIWVAEGTYFPGTTRFALKNNLALYGGFEGNETQLAQRDIALNETILTGQGTNAIVNGGTTNDTAVVDGFTIRDGFTEQENGGAVLNGSSTYRNCRFIDNFSANSGGAWYGEMGTPRFIACEFIGNECGAGGAAIETVDGSFVVVGCRFSGNTAAFAVIYSFSGSVTVVDSLIAGNDAAGILAVQGDRGAQLDDRRQRQRDHRRSGTPHERNQHDRELDHQAELDRWELQRLLLVPARLRAWRWKHQR
jgi:hypothetical protein